MELWEKPCMHPEVYFALRLKLMITTHARFYFLFVNFCKSIWGNLFGNSVQFSLVLLLATKMTHFTFRLYKMFKQTVKSALSNKWCYFFQHRFQGQKTMQYALFPLELSLLSVPLLNISITWIEHSHGFLCPAEVSGALGSAAAPDWRSVSPPLHSHTSPWRLTALPGCPHTESKKRERESRNLSEEAMSLVNNTHTVFFFFFFFRSRALLWHAC